MALPTGRGEQVSALDVAPEPGMHMNQPQAIGDGSGQVLDATVSGPGPTTPLPLRPERAAANNAARLAAEIPQPSYNGEIDMEADA